MEADDQWVKPEGEEATVKYHRRRLYVSIYCVLLSRKDKLQKIVIVASLPVAHDWSSGTAAAATPFFYPILSQRLLFLLLTKLFTVHQIRQQRFPEDELSGFETL